MFAAKLFQVFRNACISGRPFRYISRSVLVKTGLCQIFVQRRSGYKLRFYPTMINGAIYFSGPNFYSDEENFIKIMLRYGDVMVDVGCNIGLLSLAAKSVVGSAGRCIAFEANPLLAHYAQCNSSLNGSAFEVINAAVGNDHGVAYLPKSLPDDEIFITDRELVSSFYTVAMLKLDDCLSDTKVRLLKIDVEGYELNVLKGGASLLKRCDYVWLEICESFLNRFQGSSNEIIALLESYGFVLYHLQVSGQKRLLPVSMIPRHDFSKVSMYLAARPGEINELEVLLCKI